jgi:hypothetical protein
MGELGNTTLTPELRELLAKVVIYEAAGLVIVELQARRDRFLIDLLALMRREQLPAADKVNSAEAVVSRGLLSCVAPPNFESGEQEAVRSR